MEKLKVTVKEEHIIAKLRKLANVESFTLKETLEYLLICHRHFFNYHIPKIEVAFKEFLKDEPSQEGHLLFGVFINFQVELSNHILVEEKEVFPLISEVSDNFLLSEVKSGWNNLIEVQNAIDSHSNNEVFLSEIINGLEYLAKVHPPFSLRMLINKLKIFQELLEEHAQVEDYVLPHKINQILKKSR